MSFFKRMKNAKAAADQHKRSASQAEAAKPVPYKHVPTHAAQDAMAGAPSNWNSAENKARIIAQNKRRSAMSRTNSEQTLNSRPLTYASKNSASDLSIESVMHRQEQHPSYHASSHSRATSLAQSGYMAHGGAAKKQMHYFNHSTASSSAMKRSPLSTPFTEREDDYPVAHSSSGSTKTSSSGSGTTSSDVLEIRPSRENHGYAEPLATYGLPAATTQAPTVSASFAPVPIVSVTAPVEPVPTPERKRSRSWFGKRNSAVAAF
ncbi:hypothetical protein H2201_004079 [Coniosporium apollinis]|uniref:Uncharacterized protein n=2 Tax=Coniosporium TaxID=2810619 RepID=A0ABQ9NVS9_9PEZI|nr:hypothetical protein H2199_006375 [Cladosporium sp. JES 115]KAJ9665771.1 hypothetical protein H2201_004079 [Coniosporium apollinis]